ncbi:MAG: glycosyltransferase family 2 protein [Opitutaceae bacterium]
MNTPIVFIIYNRPDLTLQVFEMIRAHRPKCLYVIGDGPKPNSAEDAKNVELTREIIKHDWDGSITLDYSAENLGCQKRIFSGLSSVFEKYERAIILEDDCLPHNDFFGFCEAYLELYADDSNVRHITGTNFLAEGLFKHSHAMTQYPTPWGWATWRRAWQEMDLSMESFLTDEDAVQERLRLSRRAWKKLVKRLKKVHTGEVDSWAYPWLATCLAKNGLVVTPKQNLVSNIGFDKRSTHTSDPKSFFANRSTSAFEFPIEKGIDPSLDYKVNRALFELIFGGGYRKKNILKKLLGR